MYFYTNNKIHRIKREKEKAKTDSSPPIKHIASKNKQQQASTKSSQSLAPANIDPSILPLSTTEPFSSEDESNEKYQIARTGKRKGSQKISK